MLEQQLNRTEAVEHARVRNAHIQSAENKEIVTVVQHIFESSQRHRSSGSVRLLRESASGLMPVSVSVMSHAKFSYMLLIGKYLRYLS